MFSNKTNLFLVAMLAITLFVVSSESKTVPDLAVEPIPEECNKYPQSTSLLRRIFDVHGVDLELNDRYKSLTT